MSSEPRELLARSGFRARLAARALEDESFRRELAANPRRAVESELSRLAGRPLQLPEDVRIEVHEEREGVFHFVIPSSLVTSEEPNDLLVFWERILTRTP